MAIKKRQIRLIIIAVFFITGLYMLWIVRKGLYPFVVALFIAYLLNPPVTYLERKNVPRFWAIVMVYAIGFIFVLMFGTQVVPLIIRELEVLVSELPVITSKIETLSYYLISFYKNTTIPYSLRMAFDSQLAAAETQIHAFITSLVSGIIGLISHSIGLAISPVLAFYLLHDCHEIKRNVITLWPLRWRHEFVLFLEDVDKVLNGVIRGQLIVAAIVGLLISTGLTILHVKFALLIGIMAGMLDVIPYFGAIIGTMPAVLLALLESPLLVLKVILLFFIVHQLEGTIIGPKILGESVGLHPLSVILFLFIGGEFAGLVGMLLGVPIAALAKVFFKHLVNILM